LRFYLASNFQSYKCSSLNLLKAPRKSGALP